MRERRLGRREGAAAVALAAGLATLLAPGPRGRPSVLVVTLDTVRADHCSAYGYRRPTTPVLERLARAGVLFEEAYAPMATTAPAHASLFTALAPAAHGVLRNGQGLAAGHHTLAERLGAAGYRTAAFVGSFAVDGRFGFAQGFDVFDDDLGTPGAPEGRREWEGAAVAGAFDRDAAVTTASALAWLASRRGDRRPYLLWVHYYDPHAPYAPPPPYDGLFASDVDAGDATAAAIARYDAEIRETDAALGRLLAGLRAAGRAASTVVVVASDHGEGLMDHGWMHHGVQLYEEAVRVPLVLRWPEGLPAGRRLRGPVQLADVMPTLLDLIGLPPEAARPAGYEGASVAAAARGVAALDAGRPIHLRRRLYDASRVGGIPVAGETRAIRLGSWKYIEAPAEGTRELYDLARDPGERTNRLAEQPELARRFAALVARRAEDERAFAAAPVPVSAVDAVRLRALGYLP